MLRGITRRQRRRVKFDGWDDDEIYGEGFRRVKRYVERNGISRWLALMTEQDRRLPE